MNAFIVIFTSASAVAFSAACAAFCLLSGRRGNYFLLFGWGFCILLFVSNAVAAQAPPFGNMRHVLCFFPLALAPAWWLLVRKRHLPLDGPIAGAAVVSLIGALCMPLQAGWRQAPALQSPWFVPHVVSYVISYGLLAISFVCAVGAFGEKRDLRLRAADAAARFAFPFMTFGLCSGALWADVAWGRYWSWDIKEVWSLITWLVYLTYFHLFTGEARERRGLLILGFVCVIITFVVVNFAPSSESLHSYAR